MSKRNPAWEWDYSLFPRSLADWINDHYALLEGLMVLRDLGEDAAPAVEALLELRSVKSMRLGWELWEALLEGEGADPEPLLIDEFDIETIDLARAAIWDVVTVDARDGSQLRLVCD